MSFRSFLSSFQFLIVRLKFTATNPEMSLMRFQFLIVRLKYTNIACIYKQILFQFLIVRLKSAKLAGEQKQAGVSIPYSTIKISLTQISGLEFGCFNSL